MLVFFVCERFSWIQMTCFAIIRDYMSCKRFWFPTREWALGGAGTFIMDACSLSFRSAANHWSPALRKDWWYFRSQLNCDHRCKILGESVQGWLSFNSIPTSLSDLMVSSTAGTKAMRRLIRSRNLFHVLEVIFVVLRVLLSGVCSVSIEVDGLSRLFSGDWALLCH